jgi:hypothetical protein
MPVMRNRAVLAAVALGGCHHAAEPAEPEEQHYFACGGTGEARELDVQFIDTPADSPEHTMTFKSIYRGVVLIDGEAKAVLGEGITTITIPEGRHRLQFDIEGYRRYERDLLVKPATNVNVSVR